MRRFKYWCCVFFCWVVVRSGLYYVYSRAVRWCVEHKYRNGQPPLKVYNDYPALLADAQRWRWRKDTWRVGWDSFSYPSRVQATINRGETAIGDCDDWSLYLAHVLSDLEARGRIFSDRTCSFSILTVNYMDPKDGEVGGHNLCLLKFQTIHDPPTWGHASNWYQGAIKSGSYDNRSFLTIEDVVRDVCGDRWNLSWAVTNLATRGVQSSGRVPPSV